MLRSFDENSIGEPDWTQKPVIFLAGDAPDTPEYRLMLSFLQEHRAEIEIIWHKNREGITHIAVPNTTGNETTRETLSVPLLDFEYTYSSTESVDAHERLRTMASIKNSPVIVVGLNSIVPGTFDRTTLVVRKAGSRKKFTEERYLVKIQGTDPGMRFAIPYENFEPTFEYRASAHGLLQASVPWSWKADSMEGLKRFLVQDPELTTIIVSPYGDHGPNRKKLLIDDPEIIALIEASQDADQEFSHEDAAKLSALIRPMLVAQNLPEHLATRPRSQPVDRVIHGDEPMPRSSKRFGTVESLVDYLGTYLDRARDQKLEVLMGKDPSRIPPAIQAEIDAKNSLLAHITSQVDHAREELFEATDGKRAIDAEVAKTRVLINEQYSIIGEQTDGLQADLARFNVLSREVATFRTEDISELASALHEFHFIPESGNPSQTLPLRQRVAREIFGSAESTASPVERLIATIKEHDELIAKIATAIRHDPQSQINLYDATFYFLAQRAIDVARLPVSPHLRTHSVPTTRMLKIAFDNASEQERNWFTSLDRDEVIQPDIAREMMIHIINAAAAEKLGDHLTMSYVAGILSRLTFDEDIVVLPQEQQPDLLAIEEASPAGPLPAINATSAAFQAETPEAIISGPRLPDQTL